ncbi:MAG: hypothetical protein IIA40_10030 [SAR324 cluster bacterium]|nr:hypothetical protein [SAR324 cluster bacterium]
MSEKNSTFTTHYSSADAGTLAFDRNEAVEGEILACLEIVRQIRADYKGNPQIESGLQGIESRLQNLRASKAPAEEVRKGLEELMQVPLGEDKSLRLEAFRKSAAKGAVASEEAYVTQVRKMVKNTLNNAALLMLNYPEDPVLTRFVEALRGLDLKDYRSLRYRMAEIGKSPQLWHYNDKKKAFLMEWLKPYLAQLDKPIEQMSEEEFQAALKKVERLRETRLEEMTHMMVDSDREPFRVYNHKMNPLINGRDETFWGGAEVRDEFIALMSKLISRFSFTLEDRYLIFRTKDGGFCYLIGFADEAFDLAITTKDGKLGLFPHLKVFVRNEADAYAEITMEFYNRNAKAYYSTLKTAVVPFLSASAVMVEQELSDTLKSAFDMWV